jgi:3-deoxy-D-manno-octulosonic-acid transferase
MAAPPRPSFDPKVFTVFDAAYTAVSALAALAAIPAGYLTSRGDAARRERFLGRLGVVRGASPSWQGRFLVHGVSVGEVKLVAPLRAAARMRGLELGALVTSTTPAGIAEAARQVPDLPFAVFPSELPGCAARFLRALRPRAAALLETELWPSFLRNAARLDVPVLVLNGRVSERSARRYGILPEYTARRLAGIRFFGMQSAEGAARVVKLGVPESAVAVCGNVKFDGLPAPGPAGELLTRLLGRAEDPLVVGGSTHAPEERLLAESVRRLRDEGFPRLRLVVAPRHVDRAASVEGEIGPILGPPARWSSVKTSGQALDDSLRPLVVDTVGDLTELYRAATVAFVGGSLGNDRGGQNLLEPAALGVPLVHGPSVRNFADASACLQDARGARIASTGEELTTSLAECLRDPAAARAQADRARAALEPHRGAALRTIDELARRGFLVPA